MVGIDAASTDANEYMVVNRKAKITVTILKPIYCEEDVSSWISDT